MTIPHVPAFAVCIQPRPDARVTRVPKGSRYWGIRFWPDTAATVFGIPASELRDGATPSKLAAAAAKLVDAIRGISREDTGWSTLERWSLDNIPAVEVDAVVRASIRYIVSTEGGARVGDVAEHVGLGVRQLQRRFVDATGLTIKSYSRVRRLRSALARQLVTKESLSATAAAGGYADHAHFAREFAQMTGMPPTGALKHLALIDHRNVTP